MLLLLLLPCGAFMVANSWWCKIGQRFLCCLCCGFACRRVVLGEFCLCCGFVGCVFLGEFHAHLLQPRYLLGSFLLFLPFLLLLFLGCRACLRRCRHPGTAERRTPDKCRHHIVAVVDALHRCGRGLPARFCTGERSEVCLLLPLLQLLLLQQVFERPPRWHCGRDRCSRHAHPADAVVSTRRRSSAWVGAGLPGDW